MCTPKCLMIGGGVMVIVFAIFAGVFGVIYTAIMEGLLVIDKENAIYDTFVSPPVPIYIQFYFFNVNNPDDVKFYGMKPDLTEVGPFTYEETFLKIEIDDDVSGAPGTIEYKQVTTYHFVRAMSVAGEDYNITTLNAIAVLSAAIAYDNRIFKELIWPEIEITSDLFETHTVGELLFDGWEMPVYDFNFPDIIDNGTDLSGTLYDILCDLGKCIPFLEDNRLGLYFGTNGTNDGLFRVNTGSEDMDEYLYIQEWREEELLPYWNDTLCNMINGTDGTQFPPGVDKDEKVYLYTSELCRAIYLTYEKDIEIQGAVDALRFIVPPEVLEDPKINGDNACYCVKVYPEDEECLGSSMLNMASCSHDVPIVLSTPHFYQGQGEDEKFVGLNPSKAAHETFLDIEPITGVVVSASKKIQVNFPLRHYGNLPMFKSVPEVIFPILWGDEWAMVDKDDAEKMNTVLHLPFIIVYVVCGLLMIAGLIMIGIGCSKHKKMEKSQDAQDLIPMKY